MEIYTRKPVMVKYMGKEIYIPRDSFDMMQFHREMKKKFGNCSFIINDNGKDHNDGDGRNYRMSYFGYQNYEELVEGGEVDPTELACHCDKHTTNKVGRLVGRDDPFNYEDWHSESGEKMIKYYV